MATLRLFEYDGRRGRRALERLERRGASVVDRRTLARARRIVRDVQRGGDAALLRAVETYDGVRLDSVSQLRLGRGERPPVEDLPPGFVPALEHSIAAVEAFHRPQVHAGYTLRRGGLVLEELRTPLQRVGLYVPGGRFPYPSTVVMSVVPARLAGVSEIVVVTPPRAYRDSAPLRYTLERLAVAEIWGMGGAHAVAALAFGTETIRSVDLIAGPGGVWVAAAKQLVARSVGVDREAGPSEVVVLAAADAPVAAVAADLLAQAEHDPDALAVLVTPDRGLATAVGREVERRLAELPTAATAQAALRSRGAIFLVRDLEEALAVVERLAPEHLQLVGSGAEAMRERVRRAGAVFVGAGAPVVLGDYVAGPSHVLPTSGSARYASALGVEDFVRRSHCVAVDPQGDPSEAARHASVLAEVEGLAAHAAAARLRMHKTAGSPATSYHDPARFVRPELRALRAYTLDQVACRHKLDQNEVPWDLPRRLKRLVTERLLERDWARYPDFHSDALRQALGELHGWPAAGVLVGNGSNELLGLALEALARVGGEVIGAEPSFGLYEMFVRRAGARPRFLEPRADLRLPFEELRREIRRAPGCPLLLCSPNNPTGAALAPEQVERLLEEIEAPLLLDNAYGEFSRFDYRPLLHRYPHLLLLRTFSKAWSLAGLRLGYLLAAPALVAELIKVKLPYNVGHAAAVAGEVVLEQRCPQHRAVAVLRGRRQQWLELLRRYGLEVFESEANFLLVRSPDAERLRRGLSERGILVRDVSRYPGLAGCLRFAVGSGPALRDVERGLAEILGAASSRNLDQERVHEMDRDQKTRLA